VSTYGVNAFDADDLPPLPVISAGAPRARARSVILFIGDGMGSAHIEATRHYVSGGATPLGFERFPIEGTLHTADATAGVTDSAAAATAMATGFKVAQGVISVARPGDGRDYHTLFECFVSARRHVGVVTNSFLTDATPAAFAAHARSRRHHAEIARAYLEGLRPHVLMGGGGVGLSPHDLRAAGYDVVQDRDALLASDLASARRLAGVFGEGPMGLGGHLQPTLSEMTRAALTILDASPDGFLLLVENEMSDQGSHDHDIDAVVRSIAHFDEAITTARAWASDRPDVLIIVTADHETGGLQVLSGLGAGNLPRVRWTTRGHTGQDVPLYAWGSYALSFAGHHDNTEVARLIRDSAGIPTCGR
jgi:alkaline phosphatase